MRRKFIQCLIANVLVALGILSTGPAHASTELVLNGMPLVLDAHTFMLGGSIISLWGISTLAKDQHCWQGQRAWPCGEQSTIALKHLIENQNILCNIKGDLGSGKLAGQCFRQTNKEPCDVASFLVKHGWAIDASGYYARDQEIARAKKRGIWTSRFQTADDWRKGIQRFVDDSAGEVQR